MSLLVLAISASPRKAGNSDSLCDRFLQGALEAGHKSEKIFLRDKTINPCNGCSLCAIEKKPCVQKDDMAEILKKIIQADVIIMASPVYFYLMTGQMKTFIDRTYARYQEITGKKFYFIVTAADPNKSAVDRTMEGFRGFLSCLEGAIEAGVI
jgi:multimeric flavodoxin WrbA